MPRAHNIDQVLERWSRWCHAGGVLPNQKSMMQTIAESNGFVIRAAVGSRGPVDSLECGVESAVTQLCQINTSHALSADILRMEHHAGCYQVVKRRKMGNFDPAGARVTQSDRAHAFGITLRSYSRHLKRAREFVVTDLRRQGYVIY